MEHVGRTQDADVEVTPEMVEAGVIQLSKFSEEFERWEDAAIRIYNAMQKAKKEVL